MSKLDDIIKDFNKKSETAVITVGLPTYKCKRIPFTSPRMNYCTFGGLPIGQIAEFFGEEHGGKTTTALDTLGEDFATPIEHEEVAQLIRDYQHRTYGV